MKLRDFDYDLPKELIAQEPLLKRDQARLMIVDRKAKEIRHDVFANIGKYLPPLSTIVVNDSKVIPARIFGKRETGGKTEVFLLNRLSDGYSFEALIRPLKRLKIGEKIYVGPNGSERAIWAQLIDPHRKIVRFNKKNIFPYLNKIGHMPLPPYIKREDTKQDQEYYQTVYAKNAGSVASPTAGLHFTRTLLSDLKKSGHSLKKVTLHVNFATFKAVEEENITSHQMHYESYSLSSATLASIQKTRSNGRKIVAVGTTSCRVLETVAQKKKLMGDTNIFIYPGYQFQMTDCLITNFHLPKTTLFMLVCAFAGKDLMQHAYQEAIREKYRFFSYGDCMFLA
ncbi:MAG: tRNA preQ1(34) S-adenosylmethionine ribosyltransferase-isomerase QueA [Candidatus Omnitrophota bacterium]